MILRILILLMASTFPALGSSPDHVRWFVLAERDTLDEAVGIALAHRWAFEFVGVAGTEADLLAVVAGPVEAGKDDPNALNGRDDIRVANESEIGPMIWTLPDRGVETYEHWRDDGPLTIVNDHFEIEVVARMDVEDETFKPVLMVLENGSEVHQTTIPESGTDGAFGRVRIAWLDRATPAPQVIFSAYTMGAHCCTVTKILTRDEEGWHEIDGGWQDGDEGYRFEDIDGDGQYELISRDDRFLYLFASYAGSWTPIRIHRLAEGALIDVSRDIAFSGHHRREIASFEHHAELTPDIWMEPGFLGGWAALKSMLGEKQAAWPRVLAARADDGFQRFVVCDAEPFDGVCPDDAVRDTSFAEALEYQLKQTGYW